MSRYKPASAYGHAISALGGDDYRLHWTVDRYYEGSRQRHPRGCHRDTDLTGALRFARKHGCRRMPDEIRAQLAAPGAAMEARND